MLAGSQGGMLGSPSPLHSKAKRNRSSLMSPENFPEPCCLMRLCRMLTKSWDTVSSSGMKFFMESGVITSWFRASRSFFQAPDFLWKNRPLGPHGHKPQAWYTPRRLTGLSREAKPQLRVQHSRPPGFTPPITLCLLPAPCFFWN